MSEQLTAKQEKFVQGLIKGKSQREAYKAAYGAKKATDATIDSNACRLLKNSKVLARYNELQNKVTKRAEEKAIITAEEVIKEIADIAKDNISNYLDFRTEKTLVGYVDGEPIFDYRTIVDMKDSKDVDTKNVSEVSIGTNGTFKFKTYCRDTALYKLAEIMGLNELAQKKQKLSEDKFEEEKRVNGVKYW